MKENSDSKPDFVIHISKGVEIKIGQTVPVLQHWQCVGTQGTVVNINPDYKSYQISCDKCGKNVSLDTKTLIRTSSGL